MRYLAIFLFLINSSYALDFFVIPVTSSPSFNYFFSIPLYATIVAIPLVMAIAILGRIK